MISQQHIPLSTIGKDAYTPESLTQEVRAKLDPPQGALDPLPVFSILIPSYEQRDRIQSLLFSHGNIPVSIEHGRAVLISEIYEVYKADDDPLWNEDPTEIAGILPRYRRGDPDEVASFLEGYWQRAEIFQKMTEHWALQEQERLRDMLLGADAREAAPFPEAPFTVRETARAQKIAVEMLDLSLPYRQLQARYNDADAEEALMLFRIFVDSWTGLETMVVKDLTGKLTGPTVEALRKELAERLYAPNAYAQVVARIRRSFSVDGETRKNSESPLEPDSSPSGSPVQSAELDASAGDSTT